MRFGPEGYTPIQARRFIKALSWTESPKTGVAYESRLGGKGLSVNANEGRYAQIRLRPLRLAR